MKSISILERLEFNTIVICSFDNYKKYKEKLKELGVDEESVKHISSLVYVGDESNTGSIKIPYKKTWLDLSYLVRNHEMECGKNSNSKVNIKVI